MQQCRYLELHEGRPYCVYWDLALCGDEDLRCFPGGWECYEQPGGCLFEGRWMGLTEYAELLEAKSERAIPEGYEFQEFRLDREAVRRLSRSVKRHPVEGVTGEFHYLTLRPSYPQQLKMVALARFQYNPAAGAPWLRPSPSSSWIATLCLWDGPCQVDLVVALGTEGLHCIDGYCSHSTCCPKVSALQQSVLASPAFGPLRADLVREFLRRAAPDGQPDGPPPSPQTVPP